jgi:hypothetical protein
MACSAAETTAAIDSRCAATAAGTSESSAFSRSTIASGLAISLLREPWIAW